MIHGVLNTALTPEKPQSIARENEIFCILNMHYIMKRIPYCMDNLLSHPSLMNLNRDNRELAQLSCHSHL